MATATYSQRLGAISDAQWSAAVARAGLGRFVAAAPARAGLFGQNVFLTTTTGAYVFRGAPHWRDGHRDDAWQFPKERLYAELLAAHTAVPVAAPQMLEDSCDIFPWPYLLMPRLPGLCLADEAARASLGEDDMIAVADAMGAALAGLQVLTWDHAGDFDPRQQALVAYSGGYRAHLHDEIARHAEGARAHDALTSADDAWLDDLRRADDDVPGPLRAVYAHNDFTLGNTLASRDGGAWAITGVVDLMTSCFGDAAADLVRQSCAWLDRRPARAGAFLGSYRRAGGAADPAPARLAALVAYERLLIWEYFTRPPAPMEWTRGLSFRAWAEPYAERLAAALAAHPLG